MITTNSRLSGSCRSGVRRYRDRFTHSADFLYLVCFFNHRHGLNLINNGYWVTNHGKENVICLWIFQSYSVLRSLNNNAPFKVGAMVFDPFTIEQLKNFKVRVTV